MVDEMVYISDGVVTGGVGGLYEIRLSDGTIVSCRAKGVLKRGEGKVLVGDRVSVQLDPSGRGETVITEILPRRCALIRPPLANVTALVVTVAAKAPLPSFPMLDRLLAICEYEGITPVLAITKEDLDQNAAEELAAVYRLAGYEVFLLSAEKPEGDAALLAHLNALATDGGLVAFAGASGVGKSTLLGRLFPSLSLKTGSVSEKTARGRHTTREVTLFPFGGGYVADTPGFSLLDFERFDFLPLEALTSCFRDIAPYTGNCRYDDCSHTKEEGCLVLAAVREGRIAQSRHETYLELYAVLKAKKSYDKKK